MPNPVEEGALSLRDRVLSSYSGTELLAMQVLACLIEAHEFELTAVIRGALPDVPEDEVTRAVDLCKNEPHGLVIESRTSHALKFAEAPYELAKHFREADSNAYMAVHVIALEQQFDGLVYAMTEPLSWPGNMIAQEVWTTRCWRAIYLASRDRRTAVLEAAALVNCAPTDEDQRWLVRMLRNQKYLLSPQA